MFSYCFILILEKFHICESYTIVICNSVLQCDAPCVGCASVYMAWMHVWRSEVTVRRLLWVFSVLRLASHWVWNSPFRLGCLACGSPLPVFFLSGALGLQMCAAMPSFRFWECGQVLMLVQQGLHPPSTFPAHKRCFDICVYVSQSNQWQQADPLP